LGSDGGQDGEPTPVVREVMAEDLKSGVMELAAEVGVGRVVEVTQGEDGLHAHAGIGIAGEGDGGLDEVGGGAEL
jgi:hypothetical protein